MYQVPCSIKLFRLQLALNTCAVQPNTCEWADTVDRRYIADPDYNISDHLDGIKHPIVSLSSAGADF